MTIPQYSYFHKKQLWKLKLKKNNKEVEQNIGKHLKSYKDVQDQVCKTAFQIQDAIKKMKKNG